MISRKLDNLADRVLDAAGDTGMAGPECRGVAETLLAIRDQALDMARALGGGADAAWLRALAGMLLAKRDQVAACAACAAAAGGGLDAARCLALAGMLRHEAAEAESIENRPVPAALRAPDAGGAWPSPAQWWGAGR